MSSWDDFLAPSGEGAADGSDEAATDSGYAMAEAELAEQAAALEILEADLAGETPHFTDFGDLLADGDSDGGPDGDSEVYVAEVEAELQASADEAALDLVSDGDAYGDGSY